MKDFIILAYNKEQERKVNPAALEKELTKRNIEFSKSELHNSLYDKTFGYQLLREKGNLKNENTSHFLSGDILGYYSQSNVGTLTYSRSLELIDRSDIENTHVTFEGSASLASVFQEKFVFQNDLEGIRKIFYYHTTDVLCCSTFLPMILHSVNNNWKVRKNAIISFLSSRESKWPHTFVEDILVLSPMSRMVIEPSGISITSKTFSDLYELDKIKKDVLSNNLKERYRQVAINKSELNTAVTLSGGYDSNCLTKLYTEVKPKDFTAVSVGYVAERERDFNIYDETVYAKKIADKLGIPFKKYMFDREEFFASFDDFVKILDQPGHDPSSNYIMNEKLRADGFQHVVHGIGGDANFTENIDLNWAINLFRISKSVKFQNFSEIIGGLVRYKRLFKYFKPYYLDGKAKSFHDLYERNQLFQSEITEFINQGSIIEIDREREYRRSYFDSLYSKVKTFQELRYSLSILCSPGVYHTILMAERNNIGITIPFIDTKAVVEVMNGSHFHKKVNTREFEMQVFGGINVDLLAKRKSGFSIPYNEWLPSIADSIFEYFLDLHYFTRKDFDLEGFRYKYEKDSFFSKSVLANAVLWKLLMVKSFVEENKLQF